MCKICASKCKGCTETVLHNWLNMHEIIGASYKLVIACFVLAPVSVSITCHLPVWVQQAKPHTWIPNVYKPQCTTWCRYNYRGQLAIQSHLKYSAPSSLALQLHLKFSFCLSPILWIAKVWFREVQQEHYWRKALPTNFYCNRVEFIPAGFLQMQIGQPKILYSRLSRILKAGSMSACNSISWGSTSLSMVEKIMKKLQNVHSSQ